MKTGDKSRIMVGKAVVPTLMTEGEKMTERGYNPATESTKRKDQEGLFATGFPSSKGNREDSSQQDPSLLRRNREDSAQRSLSNP